MKAKNKILNTDHPQLKSDLDYSSIIKNDRIINNPGDDLIIINSQITNSKEDKTKIIDLNETFGGFKGNSIYNEPLELSMFPHIKKTIWYSFSRVLDIHTNSSVISTEISYPLSFFKRFYTYLFSQGIYRLSQIQPNDIKDFTSRFMEENGWWSLLDYDNAISSLIEKAQNDPAIINLICGIGIKEKTRFQWNRKNISLLIGLPLNGLYPKQRIEEIRSLFFPNTLPSLSKNHLMDSITKSVLAKVFKSINSLAFLPSDVDRISFIPFTDVRKKAKALAKKKTAERTTNITPDYAVKLISTAYEWVYTKSPGVIELVETARNEASNQLKKDSHSNTKQDNVRAAVRKKYSKIKKHYGFPWKSIGLETRQNNCEIDLGDIVRILQYAAFNLIGINHGRRKNEILGEDGRPYGLYLGCIHQEQDVLDLHSINIYIEKTLKDWKVFRCNKMVKDSVDVLEQLYQLFRPIGLPLITPETNVRSAIDHNLFLKRSLSNLSNWKDPNSWPASAEKTKYNLQSDVFFQLVDPNEKRLNQKSHPNRRLFGCLYFYRFEYSELAVLRDHLVHIDSTSTNIYVTDPDTRKLAESMQDLWKMEEQGFHNTLQEVETEYFQYVLMQILSCNKVGGYWPRLVAKRMKTLNKHIDFRELELSEKAQFIQEKLSAKGYRPNPKSNGVCMVGHNKRTHRMSNCYDDGINPQDAEPKLCLGCIHLFTNKNYIQVMEEELAELYAKANDYRLPEYVRSESLDHAKDLEKVVNIEKSQCKQNQKYLSQNIKLWSLD